MPDDTKKSQEMSVKQTVLFLIGETTFDCYEKSKRKSKTEQKDWPWYL